MDRDKIEAGFRRLAEALKADERTADRHRLGCAARRRPWRWVWGAIAAWDCVRLAVHAGKARGLGLVDSLRGFV